MIPRWGCRSGETSAHRWLRTPSWPCTAGPLCLAEEPRRGKGDVPQPVRRGEEGPAAQGTRVLRDGGRQLDSRGRDNLEAARAALQEAFEREGMEPWREALHWAGGGEGEVDTLFIGDDLPDWMRAPEMDGGDQSPSAADSKTLTLFPYVKRKFNSECGD
mmetsp:Transcript_101035/g.301411  ORF Transcript_101035/g.301411 Transcript_101035/m.301411 type:complete len:160 (-) Transcript_101035:62-541(-)